MDLSEPMQSEQLSERAEQSRLTDNRENVSTDNHGEDQVREARVCGAQVFEARVYEARVREAQVCKARLCEARGREALVCEARGREARVHDVSATMKETALRVEPKAIIFDHLLQCVMSLISELVKRVELNALNETTKCEVVQKRTHRSFERNYGDGEFTRERWF